MQSSHLSKKCECDGSFIKMKERERCIHIYMCIHMHKEIDDTAVSLFSNCMLNEDFQTHMISDERSESNISEVTYVSYH